jgi:hypothetical protein
VIHAAQQVVGVANDLVTSFAFDIGNEPNAAAVLFVGRIVQALRSRQAPSELGAHALIPANAM